jgi:hypothetical protein
MEENQNVMYNYIVCPSTGTSEFLNGKVNSKGRNGRQLVNSASPVDFVPEYFKKRMLFPVK